MTDDKLAALCDGQISDAKRYDDSHLFSRRKKALDFLEGRVDIPAEKNKSSVTSHDMSDIMGWIMPGMLRVFLASDKVVVYSPSHPVMEPSKTNPQQKEDVSEDRANQATDYINYVFLNDCAGYSVLQDSFYDGLAMGNGVIKHWWDDSKEYTTESFTGLSDAAYEELVADDDVEKVLEHTAYPAETEQPATPVLEAPPPLAPDGMTPDQPASAGFSMPGENIENAKSWLSKAIKLHEGHMDGSEPTSDASQKKMMDEMMKAEMLLSGNSMQNSPSMAMMPMLHDCKIKRIKSNGRLRITAMPPEEFLIHRSAKRLDEETIACGHQYVTTRSSLIKQGYSKDKVKDIPTGSGNVDAERVRMSREDHFLSGDVGNDQTQDKSTERVDVYEWYPLVDYNGDGIAERRKVVMAGIPSKRTILENEEWGDDLPFTDIVPDPMPHRWRGRSLYDEVADVQRIKTVLQRQTLDNLYMTNNPMNAVLENSVVNMDALINRELGANIFVKQAGAIAPLPVEFTAQQSFAMLEYLDQTLEKRTGVSRSTMALDMDALQNQTATATNAATAAAAAKNETYSRNIAEVGLKRLFRCLLKLVTKHQDRPRTIRLRGEWVEMDPRGWDVNMDVAINTGLGSGSRDRDLAMLNAVKQSQELIIQTMGPNNPLVSLDKYRNTLAKMVEAAGLKDPDQFYGEITPEIMQQMAQAAAQPKPDPKETEAQARVQIEMMKANADMQMRQQQSQADAEHRAQEAQMKAGFEREKAAADLQLQRDKAAAEMQLMRERAQAELQNLAEKAAQDFQLKREELALEAQLKREQMAMEGRQQQETNIQEAAEQ